MSSKEHKWWAKVRSAPLAATAPASPGIPTTFIKKMVRQHVGAPIPTTITAHELRNAALSLRLVAEDPTPCADLPIHVIGCILHKALDAGFTRECLGLMHMCRAMRDMCLSDEGITTKLFATIGATPQPRSPRPLMEQFAMAYSGHTKTCFFCKAGGLRRVHDDLGDFCACASCLQDNTVVHFDLQKTLLFTPELLDRLPFYAREYCGGSWRVTMHISLFSDADRLCREHFGMSLPERGVEAARILAERASARAAASRERARDRRRREAAIKRLCKAKGITGIEALPSFKEARNLHTGVPSDEELMEKAVPMVCAELERMVAADAAMRAWAVGKEDSDVARRILSTIQSDPAWFKTKSVQDAQLLYEHVVAVPVVAADIMPAEHREGYIKSRLESLYMHGVVLRDPHITAFETERRKAAGELCSMRSRGWRR